MSTRKIVIAAALLAGVLAGGAAQARGADVQWSVTIGAPLPGVIVRAPVLLPPAVVISSPAPVYPAYPVYRDERGWRDPRGYREPTRWDVDGDGVPNRYDRVYNPRWDRDGDGVPNRYDRRDDRRDDRRGHDDRRGWDHHGR